MSGISLGERVIGPDVPPFVIAEMSGNHNGSLDRALAIVDAAADAGARALKLQTYTADTITLDSEDSRFRIDDPSSLWAGQSLHSLYAKASTPWEWHAPIFERARARGLVAFSTPFDETAVDLLEQLGVSCYKIASFENVHLPLIRAVAATGKPLMMSTGMASVAELDEAVDAAREAGCRDLVLLKCTSSYPSSAASSNLRTVPHLREMFGCEVGLSDHTLGTGAACAAVAMGATVIEKHFTLSRADGGVDAAFSMEPDEMASLVRETENAWLALGRVAYGPTDAERPSLKFRRSLWVVEDIRAGDVFTLDNVRSLRPADGLAPKYLEIVLGRRAVRGVAAGTPMNWDLLV